MPPAKRHKHTGFRAKCSECRALQKKWYSRLREAGFVDIEYGLDNPRFIMHAADPSAPGASEASEYYGKIWEIFHTWSASGRSPRDGRVAELLAAQSGDTGTVRGISSALRVEKRRPWSKSSVEKTIKEIRELVLKPKIASSIIPLVYLIPRDGAA